MELLLAVGIITVLLLILFGTVFQIHRCNSSNMKDGIREGDLVISYRLDKNFKSSDVLVTKQKGETYISRVIAIEGDIVDINDEGLIINGSLQEERNKYQITIRYEEGVRFPVRVTSGKVFISGDTGEYTTKSRAFGLVDKRDTYGKVKLIIRGRNF